MFDGSSNIIIQGGTFIVVNGNLYQADTAASKSTAAGVENHNNGLDPAILRGVCHVPDTEQFSYRFPFWGPNAQEYGEPETYPTVGCHSTTSFGTSVYACGQFLEDGPCHMPTPTISREGSLSDDITFTSTPTPVMSADVSGENTTLNNDLHPPPFPMPDYYSKPLYATYARHCPTFPEPEHYLGATHPASDSSSHQPIGGAA